jgi:tRNA-2-methylthio-N6-dimethylallyladenosine synthase
VAISVGCNNTCTFCIVPSLRGKEKDRRPGDVLSEVRTLVEPVETVRPGDMVEVEVTYAAPHHLVADGPVRSVRRTRAGDAWERRTAAPAAPSGVLLGMPAVPPPTSQ